MPVRIPARYGRVLLRLVVERVESEPWIGAEGTRRCSCHRRRETKGKNEKRIEAIPTTSQIDLFGLISGIVRTRYAKRAINRNSDAAPNP